MCADLDIAKTDNNNLKTTTKDATKTHEKGLEILETEIKNLLEDNIFKSPKSKKLKHKIKKGKEKVQRLVGKGSTRFIRKLTLLKRKCSYLLYF